MHARTLGELAAVLVLAVALPVTVQAHGESKLRRKNPAEIPNITYAPMDINNVFNYFGNNGDGAFNPYSMIGEGFEFPIGVDSATTVLESGLIWTAFKNDTLVCGGSEYNHGLQPGRIVKAGAKGSLPVPDDPGLAEYRVYRVRMDIRPSADVETKDREISLLQENEVPYIDRYEAKSATDLLNQYWKDWNEWPADQGAPFADVNHDGKYEPGIDIPGFPGADQTEWMVMNDADSQLVEAVYASHAIGLEVQRTIWAYDLPGPLDNTVFMSYKLINESGVRLDSMYVAQWADPDIGYPYDDAAGCDTSRELGFAYNGRPQDPLYQHLGMAPPAVGFDLLQGPMVPGTPGDTAVFEMRKIPGHINLPVTSFVVRLPKFYEDPNLQIEGMKTRWYRMMRGLNPETGAAMTNPENGLPTTFAYTGDPVGGTGWTYLNDTSSSPADVRIAVCSGPFTMEPGDTQQIVVAELAGSGDGYLSSVAVLRQEDDSVRDFYRRFSLKGTSPEELPQSFSLLQNYPNPFNPSTTIRYTIPFTGKVTICIYNVLGEKVATLVDAFLPPGSHSVIWNPADESGKAVPSGVYFCRIEVTGISSADGYYTETEKMLFLK